jgi:uncharacterized protein (TIRG00374 family)
MREGTKRLFNLGIGIALAALLIWLFFKDADWTAVGASIAAADPWLLALALAIQTLGVLIKSWRWRLLLTPIKARVPLHSCWKYFNVGFACTSLLPGRIGEVVRPYLLAREQSLKFLPTFATIVSERVIDLLAVLAMFSVIFIAPSALGPNPDHPDLALLRTAGLMVLLIALVAAAFLVLIRWRTDWAIGVARALLKPAPAGVRDGVVKLIEAFAEGVGGLKGFAQIGGLLAGTIFGWLTGPIFFWLAFKAFGIEVPLLHCLFLQAVAALGVTIPTPAGSGGFHGGIILVATSLWGLPSATIQGYAIVTHLLIFGTMTLVGVLYLLTGRIDIFSAAKAAKSEQ